MRGALAPDIVLNASVEAKLAATSPRRRSPSWQGSTELLVSLVVIISTLMSQDSVVCQC